MPTISIITAVGPGRDAYLPATYESLRRQSMPTGWGWEWIVQEDGESRKPIDHLPADDHRVQFDTGRQGRASMARTIALSRTSGVLMRTLDADDVLPDGALAADIGELVAHPEAAWCVSAAEDLMPDGSLVPGPYDPEPGQVPPQFFYGGEQQGALQVVGTTICAYTSLVRALGGWIALPASEDVELLLAAEAVSPGRVRPGVGLLYRQWPGASTEEPDYARNAESAMRRSALLQRADALRDAGWSWRPTERLNSLRAIA